MKVSRGSGIRQGRCFAEIQSETFWPCIGFISDKYRVSQELLKNGKNYIVDFQFKGHINVCSGGDLCSPFFSNFSETPCVKIGFEDFLPLMNEGRFLEGGRFHFLLSSQTLLLLAKNCLLVIQKQSFCISIVNFPSPPGGALPWQSDRLLVVFFMV